MLQLTTITVTAELGKSYFFFESEEMLQLTTKT